RRDGAWSLVMIHLRRNSGAISSRARACARLSARATVLRVSADASGPSPVSTSATGSNRSATRLAKLLAMSTRLRQAVDPCRLVIGEAVWSRRTPQRPAKQRLSRHDTADHPLRTREASPDMSHSEGRLSLVRSGVHDSSAAISVLASSFRLPSLSVKFFANLSTSDGGGLS